MEQQNRRGQQDQRDRQYHHGDLRRALLDAALQLANERGIAGFTLREVARQAGVSHNAPYHHFADKAALVEALAVENFEILEADLKRAYEQTDGNALDKLLAEGVAYVRFALRNQAAFRFMFRPELHQREAGVVVVESGVARAGSAAYEVLLDGIRVAQREGVIEGKQDVQLLALSMWSIVHGLAVLLLDSSVQKLFPAPVEDEQVAQHVVDVMAAGLRRR